MVTINNNDNNAIIVVVVTCIANILLSLINRSAIKEVHLSLNSRLDQLVKASFQSGRTSEIDKRDGEILEK